ncbi:FtsX-like permease family protein [Myxococcota bacterium]|nr:FtsX-like permease family protein [Myxococcota bacterium]
MSDTLRRHRYLLGYTLAAMARRRGRSLALFSVYALVVFSLASVVVFAGALRREARALLADAPEIVVQRLRAGRHELTPIERADVIAELRGVRAARGRLWGYLFDPVTAANYTFVVPERDAPPDGEVDIGAGVARVRGASAGDLLSLRASTGTVTPFHIRRVASEGSALVSGDAVVLSADAFRRFFDVPADLVTDVAVEVANPREVATVASKIAKRFPDARVVTRAQILRTYEAVFSWREGLALVLLTGAVLALAVLAWDKASGLSAEERRELGLLKAVGWDTSDVLRMKAWEALVVSLGASLVGYLAAWAHVFVLGAPLIASALAGWSVLKPELVLVPEVDPLEIVTLMMSTVLPYVVATLVPAWRAATVDPDQVMR